MKNDNDFFNDHFSFVHVGESHQTKVRGTNSDEYEIYTAFTDDEPVKTYDEWLNS